MGIASEYVSLLRDSIRDGSFPDSDQLLTADITSDDIPHLLQSLGEGREILSQEIRDISKDQAGDVDEWIVQAEKVQADIAKCKIEARQIVEEHERTEAIRQTVREASSQVQLLEAEIAFTRSLEHELESIGEISQVLEEVEQHLSRSEYNLSVDKLNSIKTSTTNLTASRPRSLLLQLQRDIHQRLQQQILDVLDKLWTVRQDQQQIELTIKRNGSVRDDHSTSDASDLLQALSALDTLHHAISLFVRKLETFTLPMLSFKHTRYPSHVTSQEEKLIMTLDEARPDPESVVTSFQALLQFLETHLPKMIRVDVAKEFLPKQIPLFITKWLDTAIPYELDQLPTLESLKQHVLHLKSILLQHSWPGSSQLEDWINRIPDTWLAKRHTRSLEAVRRSFASAQNVTRQVERIERQIISHTERQNIPAPEGADDWNADWDTEPSLERPSDIPASEAKQEDDTSGWDLDIEDDQPEADPKAESHKVGEEEDDDAGEAWGWGDESPNETKKQPQAVPPQKAKHQQTPAPAPEQEIIMTELYTVTDIPDHILETIGRDLVDSQALKANPKAYFDSPILGGKLQTSPTLVLAMYRAIAPTHYSHSTTLTNMHLYNDTSYIAQTLSSNPDPALHLTLEGPITSLHKFARQIYTRELDTQRTILTDLLDGAQGFESCSDPPYKRECELAIASTVDRVRAIQTQWQPILGPSHLSQSIGSLVTMVRGKIIRDILDMEDITEAQGTQLITLCQKISALDSLFIANTTAAKGDGEEAATTSAPLYIPNYFRFQYLTQILESNLVEIRYLWNEGELSLEFSADEVVDLIRALFAESMKRREAIAEVKRGK